MNLAACGMRGFARLAPLLGDEHVFDRGRKI